MAYSRSIDNPTYLTKAGQYIYSYFEKYSSNTVYQRYKVDTMTCMNVVTSFGPEDAKRIIIGAHYDVPKNIQGADKNASGVAALLELAALLKKVEKQLRCRIDLVAYTLHYAPNADVTKMGSYVHAKSLSEFSIPVLGMMNLDGLGFYTDVPNTQSFPYIGYKLRHGNRANFLAIVQQHTNGAWSNIMKRLLIQYAGNMRVIDFKPAVPFEGFTTGDHEQYWAFGYPAIKITNTGKFRNKYIHTDADTYETLDYFRMAQVVNMIYTVLLRFKP